MKIFEVTSAISDLQSELAPDRSNSEKKKEEPVTGAMKGTVEDMLAQQGSLSKMGKFLRDQYDMKGNKGRKIKSTGNKELDEMLTKMGFKVK